VRNPIFAAELATDTEVWVYMDVDESGRPFATLQIGVVDGLYPRLILYGGTRSGAAADLARIRAILERALRQVKTAQVNQGVVRADVRSDA
jgi:hypothetical protein